MKDNTPQLHAQLRARLAETDAWTRDVRAVFARAQREHRAPTHEELMHLIDTDPRPAEERTILPGPIFSTTENPE